IRVEMSGFAPASREVTVGQEATAEVWTLSLLPFEQITAVRQPPVTRATPEAVAAAISAARGPAAPAARPATDAPPAQATNAATPTQAASDEGNPFALESGASLGAADGLLINGSVNNAAASPFAQPRAFGNARPGAASLYNGMIGSLLGNSAWD